MSMIVELNKKYLIEQIDKNCVQYYKCKIGIREAYDCTKNVRNIVNYELIPNQNAFLTHRAEHLKNFFFAIRNSNKLLLNIIKYCEEKDYETICTFLVHSCFENILNPSFVQEDMIVIIYLLLEQIVDQKISPGKSSSSFLNGTFLYELFKHLTRKEDVRSFLQVILSEIVLQMENFSGGLLCVQINKLKDELSKKTGGPSLQRSVTQSYSPKKSKLSFASLIRGSSHPVDTSDATQDIQIEDMEIEQLNDVKIDIKGYFEEKDTTLSFLNSQVEYYKKKIEEENKGKSKESNAIFEFLNRQISNVKTKNEIYSDKIILEHSSDKNVLEKLIKNAKKIEELLRLLMTNLLDNLTGIPYTIKCICKMIDILITKKFQQLNTKLSEFDQLMYSFIFFFDTLIIPILSNPDFNGIVTKNIISPPTKRNLVVFVKILKDVLKGNLFTKEKDIEYTVFNKFLIEFFYDAITLMKFVRNTKLPSIIDKLIARKDKNDKAEDFNYDYFKENYTENIFYQSICLNWKEIITFIKIIKKNKQALYKEIDNKNLKDTIEKILGYENDLLEWIKSEDTQITPIEKPDDKKASKSGTAPTTSTVAAKKVRFIYFSDIKYRPEFENILKGIHVNNSQTVSTKSAFDIVQNINANQKRLMDQKKVEITKEDNSQKNIENIKKAICEILKALNTFTRENMEMTDSNNKERYESFQEFLKDKILEKIQKNYGGFEFGYQNMFEKESSEIPLYFYGTFVEKNLINLPEKYKKDNYSLLFTELIKEREQVLAYMKNDAINQIYLKIKNSEKLNNIMGSNLFQLKQLEKFVHIENLIEQMEIPIKLEITQDNELITKLNIVILEGKNKEKEKNSADYCGNIQDFIKKFPNFNKLKIKGKNILEYEEEIGVHTVLEGYFKHIKSVLKQYLGSNSRYKADEANQMFKDINNYMIGKIYHKIFSYKRSKLDIFLYRKCKRLEWLKPEHILGKKKTDENLFGKAIAYLEKMDEDKTPSDKMKSFINASAILENSITFYTGKGGLGLDDSMSLMEYVIIKSAPKRFSSNYKFCDMFMLEDLKKKQLGQKLTQMNIFISVIQEKKASDLVEVSEEKFGKDEPLESIDIDKDTI
ncbi:MAG: hypothetical protein MJ252_10765 [archaeon]|nr:hypothetical protein [archaeon]